MSKLPITVVIPTKNEAPNLGECLQNLGGFEHVIVLDSNSQDDTATIARQHHAEVITFQWNGQFPKKRNWLLLNHQFQSPWVLFLDADERVTSAFIAELREVIQQPDIVGFWLRYRDHFQQKPLRFGIPFRKLALFRIGAGYYEKLPITPNDRMDMEIHEHPILNGKTSQIQSPLMHFDYKGIAHYLNKHNQYAEWESKRFFQIRDNPQAFQKLTRRQKIKYRNLSKTWYPFFYFLVQYILKLGFLDGKTGLDFAIMKFFYFYQIKCRIQEIDSRRGADHSNYSRS
jgi:glycosyltransferase involved in cell wall biosynthesis